MSLKEFSQKHGLVFFIATIVLLVLLIVLGIFGFISNSCRGNGNHRGDFRNGGSVRMMERNFRSGGFGQQMPTTWQNQTAPNTATTNNVNNAQVPALGNQTQNAQPTAPAAAPSGATKATGQ